MKSESEFKTCFVNSVKAQKGYAIKLAAPTMPGLPDMYVIMPGYMPVLIEAKYFKELPEKFNRKIHYSDMQLMYGRKINSVQNYAMMGLVGIKSVNKTIYACLLPMQQPSISYLQLETCNKVTRQNKLFDVMSLFRNSPIPKIEATLDRLVQATVVGPLAIPQQAPESSAVGGVGGGREASPEIPR